MRIGVIRADISKSLFIADVEPTSQYNPMTDAEGQTRYVYRPDLARIQAYLNAQGLVASAAALILATVPVGGPVNVSSAAITGVAGLGAATVAQVRALQDLLAPRLVETRAARESFLVGNLRGFLAPTFNPDPHRIPALANGAAIGVVADDGVSALTYTAPVLALADLGTPNVGDVTLTGTGMFFVDSPLFVKFTGVLTKRLERSTIEQAGGTLSATSTVIPAVLLPGATLATTSVRVQVGSLLSNSLVLT